jgi:hypothetical protein
MKSGFGLRGHIELDLGSRADRVLHPADAMDFAQTGCTHLTQWQLRWVTAPAATATAGPG